MGAIVRGLALGAFTWDRQGRTEIAALTDTGTVSIVQHQQLDTRPFTDQEKANRNRGRIEAHPLGRNVDIESVPSWQPVQAAGWITSSQYDAGPVNLTSAKPLMKTHLSRREMDDLTLMGQAESGLEILRPIGPNDGVSDQGLVAARTVTATADAGPTVAKVTLSTTTEPVAVLPLPQKLNGVSDMVILGSGQSTANIVPNAPTATITVDRTDDPSGGSLAAASVCGAGPTDCSLRGAFQFANANPGTTISLPAGTYILSTNGTTPNGCSDNTTGILAPTKPLYRRRGSGDHDHPPDRDRARQ